MARNEALVFAALQALQPARPLQDILDRLVCIAICMDSRRTCTAGTPASLLWHACGAHSGNGLSLSPRRRAETALQRLSPSQAFNVLHLRVEEDWRQHCARWESIQDGQ